jgi:hypothetical protein
MDSPRRTLAAGAFALVLGAPALLGHGRVDQEHASGATGFHDCGNGQESLYQSFTPSASPLVAIDLFLSFSGTKTLTAHIRDGSPTGALLSTATATFSTSGSRKHFDLAAPLVTTPGHSYVIELSLGDADGVGWQTGSPGYPGGQAFGCTGNPAPGIDRLFATDVDDEAATCMRSDTALCLNAARYRVSASFATALGESGAAHTVPLTGDAGYLWFFEQENVEMVVKVLDACAFNDRTWVFASGLTDVEVELVVEHVESGERWTFHSPLGTPFPPVLDTDAFATCP